FRVWERDAQFFQRLFLLGTQFPVAVLTVKDVPLMDVGRPLVQMERPVQDVDMGTEAALKFLIKLIDDGKKRVRRDGFSHRAKDRKSVVKGRSAAERGRWCR